MKNPFVVVAVILGIVFLVLAGMYAALPAHNLPMFVPGYAMNLAKHHYTHAVASLAVAVVLFAFAWMQSGKKNSFINSISPEEKRKKLQVP